MNEAWEKIIKTTNERKTPLLDSMTLATVWNMMLTITQKPRMIEVLEAALVPTSMEIVIDDTLLQKLLPHLPSIEDVKTKGEGPMKLEACEAVAFEQKLNNLPRERRIVLIQSAIWYVIRHSVNQS